MKIGILTFPHSPSLGAMLQMGALYHAVAEMGHEVEIINYVSDRVNHQQKPKITPKAMIIRVMSALFLKSAQPSYEEFERKLNMFPAQPSYDKESLDAIAARFDRIIVGSDQVWNPVVTGHDMNFYLAFCDDRAKKASYAASFGYMQVEKEDRERIAALLNDFSYLGVREKQGQNIVRDLTGREATLVLDPTLLVDASYLRGIMQPANRKKKYVLFFCVKPSPKLRDMAHAYAKQYGCDLVTIGGRMKDRFDPTKHPVFGAGPKEFLGLIADAECVFTNSFHGLAISVALHRDFYVEYSSDTNSRLANLIEMLGLADRVAGQDEPIQRSVDYQLVDSILQKEKEKSHLYLKHILT